MFFLQGQQGRGENFPGLPSRGIQASVREGTFSQGHEDALVLVDTDQVRGSERSSSRPQKRKNIMARKRRKTRTSFK